jgi:hypothetical protein
VDPEREITVPAGIVLSDEEAGSLWFRLPQEGEEIAGVCLTSAGPYLEMAREQIEEWRRSGTLPYAREPAPPLSPAWWEHVRGLMQWRVRLDPPRPIDCRHPKTEIESLYTAWVRPQPAAANLAGADGRREPVPPRAAGRQGRGSRRKTPSNR